MSSSTALLASLPSWDLTENCPIGTAHLAHQCHWPRALLRFPGIFYLFIYLLTYLLTYFQKNQVQVYRVKWGKFWAAPTPFHWEEIYKAPTSPRAMACSGITKIPLLWARLQYYSADKHALSYFLLQCMKVKSEREVAQSCSTLRDSMAVYQAPPSKGFSRQEYWSGVLTVGAFSKTKLG